MITQNFDVIIVGCGPTGATFANYLGKLGLNTLIFDKESQIIDYPRAVHIDEDVVRVFQELELYENMKHTAIKPFSNYCLVSKNDKTLFKFHPKSSVSESIADCNWILQPELEKYIREGFHKYPNVTFWKGIEWIDFENTDNVVWMRLKNEYGTFVEVSSKYLIACDGGKSPIRKKLNIEIDDLGFRKEWFVVDTYYNGVQKFSEDHKQYCDPKQPITYVNGVRNHFRWEFMVPKKKQNLTDEELESEMLPKLQSNFPLQDFSIIRKKKYVFHTVIAKKWREGNVFLAGDAAHQMPPFLGQGMCSGIKDAKNLVWKLKIACDNNSETSSKLLDTYYTERVGQVRKILKLAAVLGGFIQYSNPYLSPVRDAILKFLNLLPSKPIDNLIDRKLYALSLPKKQKKRHSLIGRRLPQPKVLFQNNLKYLDELLGMTWNVIVRSESINNIASNSNLYRTFFLGDVNQNQNNIQSSKLEEWMKTNKIDFVIVRPDKFIDYVGKQNQIETKLEQLDHYLKEIKFNPNPVLDLVVN